MQYSLIQEGIGNIWQQPIDGGSRTKFTRFTSAGIFDFNWSVDRAQLFLSRGGITSDVVLLTKID